MVLASRVSKLSGQDLLRNELWVILYCGLCAAGQELNAVYATQTAFEMSTPIIYTTTGICIESASKVHEKIQVSLPPLQDVLEWGFMGLAKNMAYIIDFHDDKRAFDSLPTGFTMDTAGVSAEELKQGFRYNVTVADVSVGVQYNIAKASCHFKLGYA